MVPANTGTSSGAPTSAKYVTAQSESSLSAEVNLGALTTGILKHTVSGGVSTPATATASDVDSILPTQSGHSGEFLTTNGTVSSWAAAGGGGGAVSIIDVNTTQTGNTAATETDLVSKSITGGTLANNGETIEFYAAGTFNQVFTQSDLKVKFGATTIFDGTGFKSTLANGRWELRGSIIRTGATTQKTSVTMIYSQEAGTIGYTSGDLVSPAIQVTTAGETLSSASTLKITGNGTDANDVVFEFWKVTKVTAS